jgi:hypothetical protein
MLHGLSSLGVHPNIFGPTSVQFKSEINDAFPRKRHQKRHLEFCTAHLLSRMLWVRIPPGAPLPFSFNDLCEHMTVCFFDRWSGMPDYSVSPLSSIDPVAYVNRTRFCIH